MLIKKLLTCGFILTALNGCVQSSAFLGPAVTGASTGNIYQAGLSYSSNLAIKEITGMTPVENFQKLLIPEKNDNKIVSSVKKKLEKHTQEFIEPKKNNNKFAKIKDTTIEKNSNEFYALVTNLYLQDQSN